MTYCECDNAARHVMTALGSEEVARREVGGGNWWRARFVPGCIPTNSSIPFVSTRV
ncbi:unnamed protein product, partial [Mycena citricolor]